MFKLKRITIDESNANRLLSNSKITAGEYIEFITNFLYQKAMPKSTQNVLKIKNMAEYGEKLPDVNIDGLNLDQVCEVFNNLTAFQKAIQVVQEKLNIINENVKANCLGYENGHIGESTVSAPTIKEVVDMIVKTMQEIEPEDLNKIRSFGDSVAKTMIRAKINISASTLAVVLNGIGADMFKIIAANKARVD